MSYSPSFYPFHYKTIDYAGLFPPAELSFDEAIKNYAKYRVDTTDSWMLSRFIIPYKKLSELVNYKSMLMENPPFAFSVLGGITDTTNEFKKDLDLLLFSIDNIVSTIGNKNISVESLELKIPILQDILFILNIISDALSKFDTKVPLEIYLEFNLSQKHNDDLKLILRHIKDFNFNNKNPKIKFIGYKVRTGGLEPKAFPSVDKLASVIFECSNFGVQLKATAGLHHPIRHYNSSVQTHMYGFINVIGACVLTAIHKLNFDTICDILIDEEPANFKFTDQKFIWGKFEASKEQIEFSRSKSFIAFGSCSFDEPRDDLESLGLYKH